MSFIHWFRIYSLCAAAGVLMQPCLRVCASDHLDSPSVHSDGSLDINDLYVFQSPENTSNVVFIVTVNPLAGVMSGTAFSSAGSYQINVDANHDAIADKTFTVFFSAVKKGVQNVLVLRHDGSVLGSAKTDQTAMITGGGRLRVGVFDDPFFFDLNGFKNGFQFTGDDFFKGLNVSAIVLEIPRSELGGTNLGVWASTSIRGKQFDRQGRPAINTALIPSVQKDAFNAGVPKNDPVAFGASVRASIASLNGNDTVTANALAGILLPDVLTIDVTSNAGFLNGRQPSNDVIDAELNLLSKGGVTTDKVDANDVAFPTTFPYLAPKH